MSVSCASPRIVGNATAVAVRGTFEPRTWAVEAAGGLGSLLAQQLVAAGEWVVDVPPTLSARVRLLDSGRTDKTDAHDARSAAMVALRHARLRRSSSRRSLGGAAVVRRTVTMTSPRRTRAICRLHALLCLLIPGGLSRRLTRDEPGRALRGLRPVELVDVERKRMAVELLADVRRSTTSSRHSKQRITVAVIASGTTVTDVYGIGPSAPR